MNTRVQLEKEKLENVMNSLKNRVSDQSKIKELENLKDYLNHKIVEGMNGMNKEDSVLDVASKSANITQLKNLRNRLLAEIKTTRSDIEKQGKLINQKNQEIMENEADLSRQQEEIQYKKNLLLTRDRMLELSQEKNVYKKKVIFTLLATIFAIILAMILTFFYFK